MANEATVNISFGIKTGNIDYQSRPVQHRDDVVGQKGPCPGAFTVAVDGTDCDFSQLTTPGHCWMQNLDETNFVTYGIYIAAIDRFVPYGRLEPGATEHVKFDADLQELFTGTGSLDLGNSRLRFRADTAPCVVRVDAFEA